ncbi:PREDICTED: uncharacterized protein LOC104714798 [Camelina sativa]|uniref:Uncharacterized protein LOC104714798 n=1 Tax=Camelina sativa TaxID=90675 RepID=A0ABM0TSG6_CAMSA|nr:PREDICTED: uncharacterized protein LOC104714798 [Camelina sativa]
MKERVKVRIEKQVKERSSDTRASLPKSAMNSADQRIKPERSRKIVSFASNLMILANKALEEDESLPARIKEDTYEEEAVSKGKRELMMQPRATLRAAKALKEARLNRGLELYKIYKRNKRANESGRLGGGCTRFRRNNLSGTLQQLSFEDLVVLANAAEEYMPAATVEQDTCKQSESGELLRIRELMQPKGEAAPVKVVEDVKSNRDSSDGFRIDRLFEKKYVRRIRVKNKEQLKSTSVGVVAGTSNLVNNKLCGRKPSRLTIVDALERGEGLVYNNGETLSKSELVCCTGMKNKTRSRDETEATGAAVSKKQFDCLDSAWEQGYPKRKRSQLIIRKERKKTLRESREGKKQACDAIDNSGQEAETEDVSDAFNSSSCNLGSSFIFDVQWSNKRKRNCMKLVEAQSNLVILLIAVEAITHQLRLLDISM